MRISIGHVSRYVYSEPTKYSILVLRLTPPSFPGQRVLEWRVSAPGIDAVSPFRDGFGNIVHLVSCTEEHSESLIIAKGVVDTEDRSGIARGLFDPAPVRSLSPRKPRRRQSATASSHWHARRAANRNPRHAQPDARRSRCRRLQSRRDRCSHDCRRSAERRQRRLPGPRPSLHLSSAVPRRPGPICQRLFPDRRGRTRGRQSCLGRSLARKSWLGRVRSANRICPTIVMCASPQGLTQAMQRRFGARAGALQTKSLTSIVEVQQQSSQQQ